MKLGEDGRTLASLQTPYLNSHTEMLFHDGWTYYLGDQRSDTCCREVLLRLDESLRIVETAEAPKGISIFSDALFDQRHGRLYYNALDKRIVRFDIAAMRCDVLTTDEEIYLSLAGEGRLSVRLFGQLHALGAGRGCKARIAPSAQGADFRCARIRDGRARAHRNREYGCVGFF